MKRILVVNEKFSAGHFYKNDNFTKKENQKYFGRCYTKHGHGHNYKLEVGFQIPSKTTDAELLKIKRQLQTALHSLTDAVDHTHLNFDVPEFKKTIPTTENIALYFDDKIKKLKLKQKLFSIRLYESDDLFSEITYD